MDSYSGGAFGGAKAGAPFDPVQFAKKPGVILRAGCLFFSIIVFGCISSEGWRYSKQIERETCLYNDDDFACNYGVGIGVIAFLASIAFLAGEYLFEQMSSVKTRKHYVIGDLGFSGLWAFLYFVGFWYLASAWSKSPTPPAGVGTSNVKAAIVFCFFSMFTWGGCAWFAFQRFRAGASSAFAPMYEPGEGGGGGGVYQSYPASGSDTFQQPGGDYSNPPFQQQPKTTASSGGMMDFTTPNY